VNREPKPAALEPAAKGPLGDAVTACGEARPEPDEEDGHLFGEKSELLGARRKRGCPAVLHATSWI
jgi:hypothetical protein